MLGHAAIGARVADVEAGHGTVAAVMVGLGLMALTMQEKEGYARFMNCGCTACHYGQAVGGDSFQKTDLIAEYDTKSKAEGVAGLTGKDVDRVKFKLPPLPPSTNGTPKPKPWG